MTAAQKWEERYEAERRKEDDPHNEKFLQRARLAERQTIDRLESVEVSDERN